DGATVVVTGRDESRGAGVASATGARFVRADAGDPSAVEASAAEALGALGGLDVLVNNAGMIFQGGIAATPPDAWRELLAVNLTAAFLYSKACFGPIRDGGGGSLVPIVSYTRIPRIHPLHPHSATHARML